MMIGTVAIGSLWCAAFLFVFWPGLGFEVWEEGKRVGGFDEGKKKKDAGLGEEERKGPGHR